LKTVTLVILGFIMISMIASESMLRTDDYDSLVYVSDSSEVKAEPVKAVALDKNECGSKDTLPGGGADTTDATCQDDTYKKSHLSVRCCTVTLTSTEAQPAFPPKVYCLKALDFFNDGSVAADALKGTIAAPADKQALAVTCPVPRPAPAFDANDCRKDKNKVATSIDDCDTSSNTSRCCYVTNLKDKVGHCYASAKTTRSDAAAIFTAADSDLALTTSDPKCGTDKAGETAGNCQDDNTGVEKTVKNAPKTDADCFRSLAGKCCKVTFNVDGKKGTPVCFKAEGGLTRNSAVDETKNWFINTYGPNVVDAEISCAVPAPLPANSECGRGNDKKKWVETVVPTHKENCTSDKDNFCCLATGLGDKTKTARCVKTVAIKDEKANKGNATLAIEDKYTDLAEAPVCSSSGFISASVVALFAFMALF
jgi:hypothetical protein